MKKLLSQGIEAIPGTGITNFEMSIVVVTTVIFFTSLLIAVIIDRRINR